MPRKAQPLQLTIPLKIQFVDSSPQPCSPELYEQLTKTPIKSWPVTARACHWLWTGCNKNPTGKRDTHARIIRRMGRVYPYNRAYKRSPTPIIYSPETQKMVPVRAIIYRTFQHLFVGEYDRTKVSIWQRVVGDCELDLCVHPLHLKLQATDRLYKNFVASIQTEIDAAFARENQGQKLPINPEAGYNPELEDVIGACAEWITDHGYTTVDEAIEKINPEDFSPSEIREAFKRMP